MIDSQDVHTDRLRTVPPALSSHYYIYSFASLKARKTESWICCGLRGRHHCPTVYVTATLFSIAVFDDPLKQPAARESWTC